MSKVLPLMDPAINIETDPVEAKRILRKVDWRIIPLLQFLYMLTFLDRVNIGNARLWNLEKDLNLSGYDYNICVLGEWGLPLQLRTRTVSMDERHKLSHK